MGGSQALSTRSEKRLIRAVPAIRGEASRFFRLSPAERAARSGAFAIQRGEIEQRLDPHFYFAEFRDAAAQIQAVEHDSVGHLLPSSGETWRPTQDQVEFNYIEIGAVGIETDSYEAVRMAIKDAPSRARLVVRAGDILVSMTRPDRGAIARVRADDDGYVASTGFAVLRPSDPALRDILFETLQIEAVRLQLRQRSTGGAYPAISLDELARVELPVVDVSTGRTLSKALAEARAVRDSAFAEADDLLAGIDDFVLDALGLALPPPSDPSRAFAVRFADLKAGRVDAEFFLPRFKQLREQIHGSGFEVLELRELCWPLKSGFAAGVGDQAESASGIPHIRPTNISARGEITDAGMKYIPVADVDAADMIERGEVLFNNTNSSTWVGKSAVFEREDECACSNHITRVRLRNSHHSPTYLAALFNAMRSLGYFSVLATNFNNQAGINTDVLGSLQIPVPPSALQRDIADEVHRRRVEAGRLRQRARTSWEAVRREFEKTLLGLST